MLGSSEVDSIESLALSFWLDWPETSLNMASSLVQLEKNHLSLPINIGKQTAAAAAAAAAAAVKVKSFPQ